MLATFVAVDGHLIALNILIDSYTLLPPGGPMNAGPLLAAGKEAVSYMFNFSVQLMMPVVSVQYL